MRYPQALQAILLGSSLRTEYYWHSPKPLHNLLILLIDRRARLTNRCTLFNPSIGKDQLPDNDFRGAITADLRSTAWS